MTGGVFSGAPEIIVLFWAEAAARTNPEMTEMKNFLTIKPLSVMLINIHILRDYYFFRFHIGLLPCMALGGKYFTDLTLPSAHR